MFGRFLYIIFGVLCNLTMARGQEGLIDTSKLPKYSYLIYGHTSSGNSVQATGFFVEKNDRAYLVTACHVINGWRFESFEKISYPDTLFVHVTLNDGLRDTVLAINIGSIKYTQADPDLPDIYFIPVNIPPNCKIYKLDSLISNYTPVTKIPEKVLSFGFVTGNNILPGQVFRSKSKGVIAFIPDWGEYACSPFIYEVGYSGADLGPGDSGAPVYFLVGDKGGGELRFGGVIFGGNSSRHRASVIRAEVVKALFNGIR